MSYYKTLKGIPKLQAGAAFRGYQERRNTNYTPTARAVDAIENYQMPRFNPSAQFTPDERTAGEAAITEQVVVDGVSRNRPPKYAPPISSDLPGGPPVYGPAQTSTVGMSAPTGAMPAGQRNKAFAVNELGPSSGIKATGIKGVNTEDLITSLDNTLAQAKTPEAVRELQVSLGLEPTGRWDNASQSTFDDAKAKLAALTTKGKSNAAEVKFIQRRLGVKDDGIWGPITQGAYDNLRFRQKRMGVTADGIRGKNTNAAIEAERQSAEAALRASLSGREAAPMTSEAAIEAIDNRSARERRQDLRQERRGIRQTARRDMRNAAGPSDEQAARMEERRIRQEERQAKRDARQLQRNPEMTVFRKGGLFYDSID